MMILKCSPLLKAAEIFKLKDACMRYILGAYVTPLFSSCLCERNTDITRE